MSKVVYILRSLPGAGKSTLADELIIAAKAQSLSHAICCADDYHMSGGEYKWSAQRVAYAHQSCRVKFAALIEESCEVIIVANTNSTHKEY
jgi:hypothetical protein